MERTHFEWCKTAKTISTKMTWKKTRNDKIAKKRQKNFQNSLQRLTIELTIVIHCYDSLQASKRTPIKRHEETEKWNEMEDE